MKRIITAAAAIAFALSVTFYAPDWLLAAIAGIVAGFMLEEYFQLSVARGHPRPGRWFVLPGALVAASFAAGDLWIVRSLAAAAILLMTSSVLHSALDDAFVRVAVGLSGMVYCSFLLGFLLLIAEPSRDRVLVLFAIVWAGDAAAYYGGRAFGRHLLMPRVSPKKTVEGAVAGLGASVIAGAAVGIWRYPNAEWMRFALICGFTGIAGQIGDLAESVLKRSSGVKDSSSILPGHGGILDRLDSLLFAAPIFFWLFKV